MNFFYSSREGGDLSYGSRWENHLSNGYLRKFASGVNDIVKLGPILLVTITKLVLRMLKRSTIDSN